MILSFGYMIVRLVLRLGALARWGDRANEVEILVLRHQVAVELALLLDRRRPRGPAATQHLDAALRLARRLGIARCWLRPPPCAPPARPPRRSPRGQNRPANAPIEYHHE
jgi:hypothetical protein